MYDKTYFVVVWRDLEDRFRVLKVMSAFGVVIRDWEGRKNFHGIWGDFLNDRSCLKRIGEDRLATSACSFDTMK